MRHPTLHLALVGIALAAVAGAARAQSCKLAYGNGPLIANVKVVQLFWGTTTNGQYQYKDKLASYYGAVTNSAYFDWLREYDSTGYMLGRGSFAASYADPSPPAGTTIDETTVLQPWLSKLIDGGQVPMPDANTMYMIHMPGTVQVSGAGGTTCTDNCAYHYFYNKGSTEVRYAVIPDQNSGACSTNQGCPLTLAAFDRLTIVASHELVEAVTDPDGQGWTDNSQQCGEIGDICVGQAGSAAGYVVQLEWSNKNGKCIDHDPSVVVNDFALTLEPTTASANSGGTATINLHAAPATGAQPAALTLAADMLPAGVTAAFAPASMQSNATSVVTLTVAATVMPGSYPFTLGGKTSDGIHHGVSGMLTVQSPPPPDMAMAGSGGGGAPGVDGGAGGNNGTGGNTGNPGMGVGGNGAQNGNGNGSGGGKGGCSLGGGAASSGPVAFLLVMVLLALGRRRRA